MSQRAGKTGTTFAAAMELLILRRPLVGVLENPTRLGKTNVNSITPELSETCNYVLTYPLDGSGYGSPCRRLSKYIVTLAIGGEGIDQEDELFQHPSWVPELCNLLQAQAIGKGDPDVSLASGGADPTIGNNVDIKEEQKKVHWPDDRKEIYRSLGWQSL